jgi:Double zinc ribbon
MPGRFASLFVRPRPDGAVGPVPPQGPADGDPRAEAAPPPPAPPRAQAPRPVPPQRERRVLMQRREVELRDVGGLAVEMARRDDWRYPLLHSRTGEVLSLEERIHELDALIAAQAVATQAGPPTVAECACGAPLLAGSHFCAHCGRPVLETPPVVTCSHCGQPLPAEANFCSVCGNAVAAEAFEGPGLEDTMTEMPPDEPAREP